MKKNNLYEEVLNKYSVKELESLVKQKRIEVEKLKLNIVKKSLISYKIDSMN